MVKLTPEQALDAIKAATEQLGNEPTAYWLAVAEALTHLGADLKPMYLPGALTHEGFPSIQYEWRNASPECQCGGPELHGVHLSGCPVITPFAMR